MEPSDEGSEGDVKGKEDKEEVEEVGEDDGHAGDIDKDEFVHEDGEVHESEEVDEICAVSCAEIRPSSLEVALSFGHFLLTLRLRIQLHLFCLMIKDHLFFIVLMFSIMYCGGLGMGEGFVCLSL